MFPISFPSRAHARSAAAVLASALLLAACGSDPDPADSRGQIVSEKSVASLPRATIDASTAQSGLQAFTGAARCDVSVRQITYSTPGPNDQYGATASAAVLVPVASATCAGPFPIVAYNKGTDVIKARTLASATDPETFQLIAYFASQGYVVVAPDYLGFAESNLSYHPYLHADSQATTTIDAIRATRTSLAAAGTPLSTKLFLTGYSQGGHAAMSTHRAIERDASLGLSVTAAGPMSGPFDLTNSFLSGLSFLPGGTGGSSVFTPYVATAYQRVYGNLYTTPADYFKAPFVTGIDTLLPGTLTFTQLLQTGKLPVALGDLLTPRAIADVTDTNSGFRKALDANTLTGFTPRAPVLLCGGAKDPVVLYSVNTVPTAASMTQRGASVTAVDVETVPAFAPFLATLTPETYHGSVITPCLKVVRDNLFAGLR